jgi:predicted transcriptional regulator of viral defense system
MAAETEVVHDIREQVRSRAMAELAERQHGFVAHWQLDVGRGAIAHALATGRLHRWYRGVYAVGHRAVRREGRWMAAVLAVGPDAVLSHRAAAALWGMRPSVRPRIEVMTARKVASRDEIQVHRAALAPDEVTVRDGIPVTTPARTLVDLAAVLSRHELARALNQAEILRLPFPDLTRYRGHRGIAKLRRTEPDHTRSDLEADFLAFVAANGLPAPLVNRPLNAVEPDFRWPAHKLIVEIDGFGTHGTRHAFERDRERDRRLLAAGWRVVRLTWRQLHEDRTDVAHDLHSLLPRLS